MEEGVKGITEDGLDPRNFILCTDDCHSGTLVNEGHVNRAVKLAIECGVKPVVAIQMATLNTAQHFGVERDLGSITPGRLADFLIVDDLEELTISSVYGRGQRLAENGTCEVELPKFDYPDGAKNTVNMKRDLRSEDFAVAAPAGSDSPARVRVIGVVENQAPTVAQERELPVSDGKVELLHDVCHIALVERHRATGSVINGFVEGFGYDPIFFVPEKGCSSASLPKEVKNQLSHRAKALAELVEAFKARQML